VGQKKKKKLNFVDCVISWWRNEILSAFHNVQAAIQLSASKDWKRFEKEEYYLPRRKITCGEASNLSAISAFEVIISLKKHLLNLQKNT